MSFFDPPKFPEPFKPEPLWQMNTCPTCPNDLVCHDQGECLRPTPETDLITGHKNDVYKFATEPKWDYVVPADFARNLERQRNEAREQLASEKATRNAIIAKGIEMERQLAEARAICEELVTDSNAVTLAETVVRLERERNEAREAFAIATDQLVQVQGELRQAREENARLREAVKEARDCILRLLDNGHDDGCDWINWANVACTCGVDDGYIVLTKLKTFITPCPSSPSSLSFLLAFAQ